MDWVPDKKAQNKYNYLRSVGSTLFEENKRYTVAEIFSILTQHCDLKGNPVQNLNAILDGMVDLEIMDYVEGYYYLHPTSHKAMSD